MAVKKTINKKTQKMIDQLVEIVKLFHENEAEYEDEYEELYYEFENILSEYESRYPEIKYSVKMGDGKLDVKDDSGYYTDNDGSYLYDYNLSAIYVPKGSYRTHTWEHPQITLMTTSNQNSGKYGRLQLRVLDNPGIDRAVTYNIKGNKDGKIPKSSK